MSNLTPEKKKQLDYLLADYSAIKSEIAHRSNLQRIALAAYVGVVALIGKEVSGTAVTAFYVMALWVSSAVTLNYYARQGLEIRRLGKIASERIAPVASKLLEVTLEQLLPSQTNPAYPEIDKTTYRYNFQFKWFLFFIVPLGFTIFYVAQAWENMAKLTDLYSRAPYTAAVSVGSALWAFCLLYKHVNDKENDA